MFTTFASQTQQTRETVKSMLDQQLATLTTVSDEIGRLEQTGLTTAHAAIDESTKLAQETLGAALKARDTVKQMTEATIARAREIKVDSIPAFPGLDAFRTLAQEQQAHLATIATQLETFEAEGRARAESGALEYAKLVKESLRYGVQASAEWRKLMLEATRRVTDLVAPRA
jgi:septation ring formation regulator EzrA